MIKKILLLLIILNITIIANDNALKFYTTDDTRYVRLNGTEACTVEYMKFEDSGFRSTNCLNFVNKHGKAVFCTKDKDNCQTHGAVHFFAISKKYLENAKQSITPPFLGSKYFNFWGGSGTGKSLDIDGNQNITLYDHTVFGNKISFKGKFLDLEKLGYLIYNDVICFTQSKEDTICTKLQ